MSAINVHIQSLADVNARKPIIEDMDVARSKRAATCDLAILESGTVSGATSVMLVLSDESGASFYHECSAEQFQTLAGAVRGAVARFGK